MLVRSFFLFASVPMMICGAVTQALGPGVVPYEIRDLFPVSWAVESPGIAFFSSAAVFVIALLVRPGRSVLVNDFKS